MGVRPTHTDERPPPCHSECHMGLRPTNRDESPPACHSERSEESAFYVLLAKQIPRCRNDSWGSFIPVGGPKAMCTLKRYRLAC
jgi:hypothetical protein